MSQTSLFGLPTESQRISLLLVLFILFAIPVTLIAILQQKSNVTIASVCYDLDSDGIVKASDLEVIKSQVQESEYLDSSDFNGDRELNQSDVALLQGSLGSTCLPKVSFFASPGKVAPGEETTLTWSVEHANSVSIQGIGQVGREGTKQVRINEQSGFVLTASGPGGEVKASTHVVIAQ